MAAKTLTSGKILEFKNADWLKGISAQPNLPMGGLFQSMIGCDPFEQGGLALPSLVPASQALGTVPKFLTSFYSSANYIYAHTPTKLYQVLRDSPYTVTDVTAQINQSLTGNVNAIVGRTIWKGRYIYAVITDANMGYIISNTFPVASGSDSILQSGFNNNMDYMPMCQGPDGNLYVGNGGRFYEQTAVTGTSGNGTAKFIDPDFYIRDILNDGRYLVIFADNNQQNVASRVTGSYRCRVYFWDTVQTDGSGNIVADAVWEFTDSYIVGAKLMDTIPMDGTAIQMVTYSGIYVTNVATYPKMVRPFPTSNQTKMGRPMNPEQIKYAKGSLYWLDGSVNTNSYIYAFGNSTTGQAKIFYVPYSTQGVTGISQCLLISGNNFIMGNDNPALWFFNVGSTRGGLNITTLDITMEQPYTYGYTKVVLGQKLASGQSVEVSIYGNGGNDLISNETKVFSGAGGTVVGAKQTLLFSRVATVSNQATRFEDITITVASTGAALQRVSTYATPLDDSNVDL